jgi:hypothetical protein
VGRAADRPPGADRDAADLFELEQGLTDQIDVIRRRRGFNEAEAIEEYRGICRRRHLAAKIDAEEAALVAAAPTSRPRSRPTRSSPTRSWRRATTSGPPPTWACPAARRRTRRSPTSPSPPSVRMVVASSPNEPIPSQALIVPGPAYMGGTES